MGVINSRGLRRKGVSSERARQTIKTIETYVGRAFGSDTGDYSPRKKTSTGQGLANDNERSLGKTNKRQ